MKKAVAFIKKSEKDVPVYTPAGHDDTYNRRLIGPLDGARHVEVILGEMGSQGTTDLHVHKDFEQVLYMLEGTLRVISDEGVELLNPGDIGFIPKNSSHQVFCETAKARFMVIYAPPREKV